MTSPMFEMISSQSLSRKEEMSEMILLYFPELRLKVSNMSTEKVLRLPYMALE